MHDPKPTPDEAFKLFTKGVGHVLRQRGFKGSGSNFRRELNNQWQAINLQKSQWRSNRDDPIRFYVNIGIDFPTLTFERWLPLAATLSKFIELKADTRFRIDELFPDERLDWIACGGIDGWNLEEFSARFERLLTDQLLPLLDDMATPNGLARVLRTMPWMTSEGSRQFIGKDLAPPKWNPADRDAGLWTRDTQGFWWKQGER